MPKRRKRAFVREKRTYCGNQYMEVDIYTYTEEQEKAVRKSRKRKHNITPPKQANLNDKNARRYFAQLVNGNFGRGDYHVTLTYAQDQLPDTVEAADRQLRNYLRRLNYYRKNHQLPPLRYITVTEGGRTGRIHHHIIMDGAVDRDMIESMWRNRQGQAIGYANADRLQPDGNALTALASYLSKDPAGRKRWSCSHNLDRPYYRTNDSKYSRRAVERIAKAPQDGEYWHQKYQGYQLLKDGYGADYNEDTGAWSITLRMIKTDNTTPPHIQEREKRVKS